MNTKYIMGELKIFCLEMSQEQMRVMHVNKSTSYIPILLYQALVPMNWTGTA